MRTLITGLCALVASLAFAQAPQGEPPVAFKTDIRQAELLPAPAGFVWQRLEEIQAAVVVPEGWNRYAKRGPNERLVAFSPDKLDANNQFQTGLSVRLVWHPRAQAGQEAKAVEQILAAIVNSIESNKTDNKVLRGTMQERNGKKMLIVRHRNAPSGLPPVVVHTVAIGDPASGMVYQFIFESPETSWDESWKVGEQILSRILILFQRG